MSLIQALVNWITVLCAMIKAETNRINQKHILQQWHIDPNIMRKKKWYQNCSSLHAAFGILNTLFFRFTNLRNLFFNAVKSLWLFFSVLTWNKHTHTHNTNILHRIKRREIYRWKWTFFLLNDGNYSKIPKNKRIKFNANSVFNWTNQRYFGRD